jgi:hypothetical protein
VTKKADVLRLLWHNTATTFIVLLLVGCAPTMPKDALRLPESTLELRSIQTRSFEAKSETAILTATVATMQDMEYNIDTIQIDLGVITASKTSDASSNSAIAGYTMLDLLCAAGGTHCDASGKIPDKFRTTITMVVLPSLARPGEFTARITLHYATINNRGQVIGQKSIVEEETYQQVFEILSKAIFVQANEQ